jgi:hypothetical protein
MQGSDILTRALTEHGAPETSSSNENLSGMRPAVRMAEKVAARLGRRQILLRRMQEGGTLIQRL